MVIYIKDERLIMLDEALRRIYFEEMYHGITYNVNLEFRNNKAIIMGDSGVGKTFLAEIIRLASLENKIDAVCYDWRNIKELCRFLEDEDYIFGAPIVVLDNADYLLSKIPNLAMIVNRSLWNTFLIFARNGDGLSASLNVCGELNVVKESEERISIEIAYSFPKGVFC